VFFLNTPPYEFPVPRDFRRLPEPGQHHWVSVIGRLLSTFAA
jgi:hypothetical protein